MLSNIDTLHFTADYWVRLARRPGLSWKLSTPTRQAMSRSQSLRNFVTLLRDLNIDLGLFAASEAPMIDDGWTSETMYNLLIDEYTCDYRAGEVECRYCEAGPHHLTSRWEPMWYQRSERLKAGLRPDGPFTFDEIGQQKEWQKYVTIFYDKQMCLLCQIRFQKLGDPSIESHPGLLDIHI